MTEADSIKLFKCLSDKSRLLILKCLVKEPMYVELLSKRLQLTPSTISFHLKKLEDADIVQSYKEQYYTVYSINENVLKYSIIDIIKEEASEESLQNQREEQYKKKVVDNFFKYGKLKSIPVQRKKKLIILEKIASAFDIGKKYSEKEVNIIIADFHDDFCTIRRDLISEKIFERENGVYKRLR